MKLIGDLTGNVQRVDTVDSFIVNGVTITDKKEIVDKLNLYFVNIGSQLTASIRPTLLHFSDYLKQTYLNSFVFIFTSALKVINIVSAFQTKRIFGFHNIPVNKINIIFPILLNL